MKKALPTCRIFFLSNLVLALALLIPSPGSLLGDEDDERREESREDGERRRSSESRERDRDHQPEREREREREHEHEHPQERGETREKPGLNPEVSERRIHHLRVAAENLEQADLHREADRLREHAEDLERELRERHRREEGPEHTIDRLHGEIAELNEIVHDLREGLAALEEEMEKIRRELQDDDDD